MQLHIIFLGECYGVLYVEVILYSKECNWYTRCCPLNGGVCYRECPLT